MHEVSLMKNALAIALTEAKNQGATQIHSLKINVGELSGVVPEALKFAFDVVVRETIAQGAKLELEIIPVTCYCPHCCLTFHPFGWCHACPQCHHISTQILQGRELELASLEVS
ncbi:MAG: hydrogenase maturation nickel metallochaperone HypA [Cyanophyceae cyanobacterium]